MGASDHIEEQTNLDLSRLQRQTLERWVLICVDAGEFEQAETLRMELTEQDLEMAA